MNASPGYTQRVLRRYRSTSHNQVRFMEDGDEAYPAMLAAIDHAERAIHMESYIFDDDIVGWRFARALARAARRGVTVLLLVDAIGSYRLGRRLGEYLQSAGVTFRVFNPLRFAGWELLSKRNHRKTLVVDGQRAFVGGLNISLDHVPEPLGRSWHDALVEIRGPAVLDVLHSFLQIFKRLVNRRHQGREYVQRLPERGHGEGRVWILRNRFFDERFVIRQRYLKAIASARDEIAIANAYFLPDRRIIRALRYAAQRGVAVRLLFPGLSDVPFMKAAMEAAYAQYLRWGLQIREWPGTMLHHKLALFDRRVMCIGSYNLDQLSLRKNLEISAWIDHCPAVGQAQRAFERDWMASTSVQPSTMRLAWVKRLIAWLATRMGF